MFKNSVFHPNVDTVKWLKNAGIRAVKTVAQTMVSMLTVGQAVMDINWQNVLSVSLVAGIISVLTSITGIPEVENKESENND